MRAVEPTPLYVRRLLAVQTHLAVRLVAFLMVSAGLAALMAVVFLVAVPMGWNEWIQPVQQTALSLGFCFLLAGGIALTLLPPRRELLRSSSQANTDVAAGIQTLIIGLAIAAALHVPTLLAWWGESSRLINQLTGGAPDPSGLWIIPAAMVSAPPFVAALIVFVCVEGVIGLAAARSPAASRLFRASVVTQAGLVVGSTVAFPPIQALVARVVALAAAGPDATVVATINAAVIPQQLFASTLLFRFQLILVGYVVAAVIVSRVRPSPAPAPLRDRDDSVLIGPETASLSAVLDSLPVTAATSLSPTLDSVFTATEYRVRLRSHWLIAAFRVAPLEYAITPVPPGASDLGFSFSESDCVFRRASDGVPVLKVQRAGSRWSLNASHVIAAPSGAIMGSASGPRRWTSSSSRPRPVPSTPFTPWRSRRSWRRRRGEQASG